MKLPLVSICIRRVNGAVHLYQTVKPVPGAAGSPVSSVAPAVVPFTLKEIWAPKSEAFAKLSFGGEAGMVNWNGPGLLAVASTWIKYVVPCVTAICAVPVLLVLNWPATVFNG